MKMPKRLKIMWLCITSHLHNPHIYVRIFPPLVIIYVDGYLCNANTVQGFGFIKIFKMWNYGSLYPLYGKRVASFLIQLSIQVKPVCTRWKLVCQVKTRVPHGLLVARYFATQQICPRHTGFFLSGVMWPALSHLVKTKRESPERATQLAYKSCAVRTSWGKTAKV